MIEGCWWTPVDTHKELFYQISLLDLWSDLRNVYPTCLLRVAAAYNSYVVNAWAKVTQGRQRELEYVEVQEEGVSPERWKLRLSARYVQQHIEYGCDELLFEVFSELCEDREVRSIAFRQELKSSSYFDELPIPKMQPGSSIGACIGAYYYKW